MKPRKITPAIWARLVEVAELRKKTPSNTEVGIETGLAPLYAAQLISAIQRGKLTQMPFTSKDKIHSSEVA